MVDFQWLEVQKQFAVLLDNEWDEIPDLRIFFVVLTKVLFELVASKHDSTVSIEVVDHDFTLNGLDLSIHDVWQQTLVIPNIDGCCQLKSGRKIKKP